MTAETAVTILTKLGYNVSIVNELYVLIKGIGTLPVEMVQEFVNAH